MPCPGCRRTNRVETRERDRPCFAARGQHAPAHRLTGFWGNLSHFSFAPVSWAMAERVVRTLRTITESRGVVWSSAFTAASPRAALSSLLAIQGRAIG